MLRLRGKVWWFRRKVPPALSPFLNTAEVAISLKTDSSRVAVARSHAVWLRTDEIFRMAASPLARSKALLLLREMARCAPWEPNDLQEVYQQSHQGDVIELTRMLRDAADDIPDLNRDDLARVMLHLKQLSINLERSGHPATRDKQSLIALREYETLASISHKAAEVQPPALAVTSFVDAFITTKVSEGYTAGTVHQTRMTLRLWSELIGEVPVVDVTGRHAGDFRDLLLKLPSSHGKGSSKGKHVSAFDGIASADHKESMGVPITRLSLKTAKRHFSTMQQLWKYLSQRNQVNLNPFAGFSFPGTKSKKTSRDDWTIKDLIKLLQSEQLGVSIKSSGRDFWIVAIAMFSGMRLEEICRLRPKHDIIEYDGVWCFIIQDQINPTWTPKTEAGERVVPVHPMLIEAGILRLRDKRMDNERLVPNTRYSGLDHKLGVEFSRQFSLMKTKLGISRKTTFHSFRHSVSTILRNAEAGVRGEWIDAVLGHDGGPRVSQGISTYMKRTDITNSKRVIELVIYPVNVEAVFKQLLLDSEG